MAVPTDGRLTSQNVFSGPLTGGEQMYIVSPGSATEGNSYQVQTDVLAGYFASFPALNTTVITSGATVGSPYQVQTSDTRILFNKTVGSPSYAACPLAASMLYGQPVLFKDINNDAATNNITVLFSAEECDGQSQMQITTNYGWIEITPIPGGGGWYQSR